MKTRIQDRLQNFQILNRCWKSNKSRAQGQLMQNILFQFFSGHFKPIIQGWGPICPPFNVQGSFLYLLEVRQPVGCQTTAKKSLKIQFLQKHRMAASGLVWWENFFHINKIYTEK